LTNLVLGVSLHLTTSSHAFIENKISLVPTVFYKYNEVVLMLTIVFFQGSVITLDDSSVDGDQVDYLIKFCPTKEEMELLKVHFN
jgi:hypothetical protein